MKFQHQYNFQFNPLKHAKQLTGLPSVTIPDMAYTVRELLQKYTTGGMPSILQEGTFEENVDFADALGIDQDLVDLHMARQKVTELKEQLRREKVNKEKGNLKKYNEWLKAQREAKEEEIENSDNDPLPFIPSS